MSNRTVAAEKSFSIIEKDKQRREQELIRITKRKNAQYAIDAIRKRLAKIESILIFGQHHKSSRKTLPHRHVRVFYQNRASGKSLHRTVRLKSSRDTTKNFVSVRTRFYKSANAKSLEKHVSREVSETYDARNTASVVPELMKHNLHYLYRTIDDCDRQYQAKKGKRPRSDFRKVYENIVVFSEDQFVALELEYGERRAKQMLFEYLKLFTQTVRQNYGFEPLRLDLHLDEGHIDERTGVFRRNIHCHVQFYNYDFENGFSPLALMLKKEKCSYTGKLQTNPAMSKLQDLAGEVFKPLGFKRGLKKSETQKSHLSRDRYIAKQQEQRLSELAALEYQFSVQQRELKSAHRNLEKKQRAQSEYDANLVSQKEALKLAELEQSSRNAAHLHLLNLLNEIRNWKRCIIKKNFAEALQHRDKINTLHAELLEKNTQLSQDAIRQIDEILHYEDEMCATFERDYFVLNEQKISSLRHKRPSF